MSHLSLTEKQQLQFDWRYKGVSILNLLTESETNSISSELERIRVKSLHAGTAEVGCA